MSLPSNDDMRASDQDREDAVAILCDAFAVGRLNLADICDRAGAAYSARTWGDLRRLTADLPSQGVTAIRPGSIEGRSGIELRHQREQPAIVLLLATLGWILMFTAASMATAATLFATATLLAASLSAFVAVGLVVNFSVSAAEEAARQAGDQKGTPEYDLSCRLYRRAESEFGKGSLR